MRIALVTLFLTSMFGLGGCCCDDEDLAESGASTESPASTGEAVETAPDKGSPAEEVETPEKDEAPETTTPDGGDIRQKMLGKWRGSDMEGAPDAKTRRLAVREVKRLKLEFTLTHYIVKVPGRRKLQNLPYTLKSSTGNKAVIHLEGAPNDINLEIRDGSLRMRDPNFPGTLIYTKGDW